MSFLRFARKKFVIVARWISRARELRSVKPVSLLRPFITDKVQLSEPHLILGSYFPPPLESEKIGLRVVCRLEVALFVTLPAQSIREKAALSVPPSPPL